MKRYWIGFFKTDMYEDERVPEDDLAFLIESASGTDSLGEAVQSLLRDLVIDGNTSYIVDMKMRMICNNIDDALMSNIPEYAALLWYENEDVGKCIDSIIDCWKEDENDN